MKGSALLVKFRLEALGSSFPSCFCFINDHKVHGRVAVAARETIRCQEWKQPTTTPLPINIMCFAIVLALALHRLTHLASNLGLAARLESLATV